MLLFTQYQLLRFNRKEETMKKKALSLLMSFAITVAFAPAFIFTQTASADASDSISSTNIAVSLDYDQLTTFNTSHTGNEISAELADVMKVQSQYNHCIKSPFLAYYDTSVGDYRSVADSKVSKGNQYYIVFYVGYKEYVYGSKDVKFNGRTLTNITTGKPVAGQILKHQIMTIDGVTCDKFILPVEVSPRWPGPLPKLAKSTYTYTGSVIDNSIINMNDSVQYVSEDSVQQATNVGTYRITVKLMDQSIYCFPDGTITDKVYTWKINPAGTSLTSLSKGTKSFTAKWSKKTKQLTGYQLRYSTSSSMSGAKTVTVTSYKTTSKTVKSLKAKKKYYVQVRTYKTVNGSKYYSSWSSKKAVTTR